MDLRENIVPEPLIIQTLENQIDGEPQLDENCLLLHLDGAQPDYILQTRQCIDQHFPDK